MPELQVLETVDLGIGLFFLPSAIAALLVQVDGNWRRQRRSARATVIDQSG